MNYLKLLKGDIQCLLQLSFYGKKLFLQALFLLFIVHISLIVFGLNKTKDFLSRFIPPTKTSPKNQDELINLIEIIVKIASRYSRLWASCLRKSLVLWFLLAREGIKSDLRIGVRRNLGKIEAHAWVEVNQVVLNDQPNIAQQFSVFEGLKVFQ